MRPPSSRRRLRNLVRQVAPPVAPGDAAAASPPGSTGTTVLVTGALGHYGAQLVRLLAERGWIVLATDMKPPPSDPVATWGQSAVEYTQLDLGEVEAEAEIDRLVSRCDCVLHLGACERDTASDCIAAAARAAACAAAPATPADTTAFCGCMHLTLWCVSPLAGGRGRRPWSFAGSPGRHAAGRPRRQLACSAWRFGQLHVQARRDGRRKARAAVDRG